MSVLCEAISVIVPVDVLEEYYPGGLKGYERSAPNATFCTDGLLTRVGMMNPQDVGYWIRHLESLGMTFVDESTGRPQAVHMVVIDQITGPTCGCDWVFTDKQDGARWAWLANHDRGPRAAPANWTPEQSAGMHFHSDEERQTMPMAASGDQLTSIDPTTGKTLWTPRVRRSPSQYADLIERAERELADDAPWSAYWAIRKAEELRPLDPRHLVLAAMSASEECRFVDETGEEPEDGDIEPTWAEAARRWAEAIVVTDADTDPEAWRQRAEAERQSGDLEAARLSLDEALRLSPEGGWVLLEAAHLAAAEGAGRHVLEGLLARVTASYGAGQSEDDDDETPEEIGLPDAVWHFHVKHLQPKPKKWGVKKAVAKKLPRSDGPEA